MASKDKDWFLGKYDEKPYFQSGDSEARWRNRKIKEIGQKYGIRTTDYAKYAGIMDKEGNLYKPTTEAGKKAWKQKDDEKREQRLLNARKKQNGYNPKKNDTIERIHKAWTEQKKK